MRGIYNNGINSLENIYRRLMLISPNTFLIHRKEDCIQICTDIINYDSDDDKG